MRFCDEEVLHPCRRRRGSLAWLAPTRRARAKRNSSARMRARRGVHEQSRTAVRACVLGAACTSEEKQQCAHACSGEELLSGEQLGRRESASTRMTSSPRCAGHSAMLTVQSRCSYERARCIARQGKMEIGLGHRRIVNSLQATGQASRGHGATSHATHGHRLRA